MRSAGKSLEHTPEESRDLAEGNSNGHCTVLSPPLLSLSSESEEERGRGSGRRGVARRGGGGAASGPSPVTPETSVKHSIFAAFLSCAQAEPMDLDEVAGGGEGGGGGGGGGGGQAEPMEMKTDMPQSDCVRGVESQAALASCAVWLGAGGAVEMAEVEGGTCVCVCVSVFICIYMHKYTYIHILVFIHIYKYVRHVSLMEKRRQNSQISAFGFLYVFHTTNVLGK